MTNEVDAIQVKSENWFRENAKLMGLCELDIEAMIRHNRLDAFTIVLCLYLGWGKLLFIESIKERVLFFAQQVDKSGYRSSLIESSLADWTKNNLEKLKDGNDKAWSEALLICSATYSGVKLMALAPKK